MKKIAFFGDADYQEFLEGVDVNVDLYYTNKNRERFHVFVYWYDSDTVSLIEYSNERQSDEEYEKQYYFSSIDELINNYTYPDGALFKDVLYGENYIFDEGE